MAWFGHPNKFLFFFWFFFFKKKIKYVMGAFWKKKKVKVVELPQLEFFLGGGVKCHI
jgi:hypothetical protein